MTLCPICKKREATLPAGAEGARFCPVCWQTRLRQLFREEDRFHIQRILRAADAEKYLVYHDEFEDGAQAVAVIFAMLDRTPDHLEVSAFLYDTIDWHANVPFIYENGVEAEVEVLDVFLGILESDLVPSWRTTSWAAEVTLCTGQPFWIDSREQPDPSDPDFLDPDLPDPAP